MRVSTRGEGALVSHLNNKTKKLVAAVAPMRYKLALRGRQDAENRRTRSTSDQSTPMIWGWSVDAS
ncbi:unnamed protein product [Ectocarpus sp. CCAP 1310/34]|nr:unnamed protein product [Ectocarpus sp. CCAP 1310/34]